MDHINRDFDSSREFIVQKNRLLIEYNSKLRKTKLKRKKQLLSETLTCIKKSRKLKNINACKHNELVNLEKIFLSYEDNPRLKNIISKNELVSRYEIRVEMAKLDNSKDKIFIFSKTLNCFKSSRTKRDIYSCKKNEKDRILKLLKS